MESSLLLFHKHTKLECFFVVYNRDYVQLLLRYILDTCIFTLISILKTDGDNSSCEMLKGYIGAKIHGNLAKSPYYLSFFSI